jgi:hypothetical protein
MSGSSEGLEGGDGMAKTRLVYLVLMISALVAVLLAHVHGFGMSDGGGW